MLEGGIDPNDRASFAADLEQMRWVAGQRDADFSATTDGLHRVKEKLDEARGAVLTGRRARVDRLKSLLTRQV